MHHVRCVLPCVQRRHWISNAALLLAPLLFCALLAGLQLIIQQQLNGPEFQCGCQCISCCAWTQPDGEAAFYHFIATGPGQHFGLLAHVDRSILHKALYLRRWLARQQMGVLQHHSNEALPSFSHLQGESLLRGSPVPPSLPHLLRAPTLEELLNAEYNVQSRLVTAVNAGWSTRRRSKHRSVPWSSRPAGHRSCRCIAVKFKSVQN